MSAERVANLQRAMQLIADAVEDLPAECRDLAGNALLNVTAEAGTWSPTAGSRGNQAQRVRLIVFARGPEEED